MQSRRDQVQAHAYVLGRLTSALVRAEPDAPETPLRRTTVGAFTGLLIGALVVAGFAIIGLIFPKGGDSWREPGTLVVEEESGTRYVFLDGRLRPVFNFASARLLLGDGLTVETVASATLDDVPRGQAVGIVGAPDSLPAEGRLRSDAWLVCASSAADEAGKRRPQVTLQVGSGKTVAQVADDNAVVARGPDGTLYLAWRAQRLRLTAPWVADALGYRGTQAMDADAAWLNALPAGPDLKRIPIPDQGAAGPQLDGRPTRIGQVFIVANAGVGDRFYVLRREGLAPLSRLEAALLLGDPRSRQAYPGGQVEPVPLSPATLSSLGPGLAQDGKSNAALPTEPPRPVAAPGDSLPCLKFEANKDAPRVELIFAAPPANAGAIEGGPGITLDERVAGRISATPGSGVLARVLAAPGAPGAAIYLITDTGIKYPVANDDAVSALGYKADDAVPVPSTLLALLPTGPALSKIAAGGEA